MSKRRWYAWNRQVHGEYARRSRLGVQGQMSVRPWKLTKEAGGVVNRSKMYYLTCSQSTWSKGKLVWRRLQSGGRICILLELVAAIKEIEKGILFNLGQGHLYPKMSHEQTSSNQSTFTSQVANKVDPSSRRWQTHFCDFLQRTNKYMR